MTTIVAVRKSGRTCIVADSLTTCGKRKELRGQMIVERSKLFRYRNAIIGFSGSATWKYVFLDFLNIYLKDDPRLASETLLTSFSRLWRSFRSRYFIESYYEEAAYYFSLCQIVIATQESLFKLTLEGAIIPNEDVVVIGGGYPFAYGAVRAMNSHTDNPFELAMVGMRAAAAWDPNTLGPFSGWHISELGEFSEVEEL